MTSVSLAVASRLMRSEIVFHCEDLLGTIEQPFHCLDKLHIY